MSSFLFVVYFLTTLHSMWEFSFLTVDQTHNPCIGRAEYFFFRIYLIFWLRWVFIAAYGLSSCGNWGLFFVVMHRLLIAVASLVAEHRPWVSMLQQLQCVGSVAVTHRLERSASVFVAHRISYSTACGVFLEQGSNSRPLHWQADFEPLDHQGSPSLHIFKFTDVKYIHLVVSAVQWMSRTFSSCKAETLCSLNNSSPFAHSLSSWQLPLCLPFP